MSVQIITSRHTVNRLSDFQLDMVLEKDGVLYMPASFVMAFYVGDWSCEDAYVASRLDGQTTNCEISGSVISVYFNSPGFPIGQLKCRVFDRVDNAAFTDGTLDTCTPLTLPIEIVATAGDSEVITLYSEGYQPPATGIPKGDLEQSVQDTLDSVANKVDKVAGKGLSTEDFTAALKAKLEALDPYTKTETDNAIANAVEGLGGGSVESVTVNGVNHTPVNGVVDLGTIQGAKGDKGEKGDTVVIDPEGLAQFEIANDLDTSDPTQGLSARQGKILKQAINTVQANLQAVVDALANMAFTSAKPTLSQIDWTGGTFYATINKTLNGCTTQNMNTEQVAEGQQFSMVLSALTGYTLTGATISVTNSKGQSVAYTFDNNTLTIAAANVVGTINISVAAKAIYQISLGSGSRNVSFASGTVTEAIDGSSWTGTIEAASGHRLPASINVTMGGTAVTPTYNSTSGEITIASVTGNIVITAVAEEMGAVHVSKTVKHATISDNAGANDTISAGETYQATLAEEKVGWNATDPGYVLDATAVSVTVNGVDKTTQCWDATNKTITVANPDGEIVINVLGKIKFLGGHSVGSGGGAVEDADYMAMRTWIRIPDEMFSTQSKVSINIQKTDTATVSGKGRYLIVGVKTAGGGIGGSKLIIGNNDGTNVTKEYTLQTGYNAAYLLATFKTSDIANGKITAINPDSNESVVLFDGSNASSFVTTTE